MATSKSTRSPAFQFYPKDFLSSSKVGRMSLTERGAYITLLSVCWLDGGLPTDMAVLARLVGMKRAQFDRMWANGPLHECFYEKGGRFHNARLDKERQQQAAYRRKQKENADRGWQSRRNATALPSVASESHPSGNALQSASAICDLHPAGERRAPLMDGSHKKHAHCGRVCLHASLFGEFVRRRNHPAADREVRDWALEVEREWAERSDETGDPFDFWRARYAEKWPAPVAARHDSRRPSWVV